MARAEVKISIADLPEVKAILTAQEAVLHRLYDGWEDVLAEDSAAQSDEWRKAAEYDADIDAWSAPYEPMTLDERAVILRLRAPGG